MRILCELDHPNIVKYYETFEDAKFLYLVMEYCPGGELLAQLTKQHRKGFTEQRVVESMEDLLKAVAHCHSSNVVHRDIKPENVMIGSDGEIKLIDFGLSQQTLSKNTKMHMLVGTPLYMSPQVIEGYYGQECDIWSLGVVMYFLLTGYLPFYSRKVDDLFEKILSGNFAFPREAGHISKEAKDLIRKMLTVDQSRRITAQAALKHPVFELYRSTEEKSDRLNPPQEQTLKMLKKYQGKSALRRAALNVFVKMLTTEELDDLHKEFEKIDVDNSGIISARELENALKQANMPLAAQEIARIIHEIDYNGKGQMHYSEFIAATIHAKEILLSDERLEGVFRMFDRDRSGSISKNDIQKAMNNLGEKCLTQRELNEIITKHDKSHHGTISLEDFKLMMREE